MPQPVLSKQVLHVLPRSDPPAAALQADCLPALVDLLGAGPDSVVAECAARALHVLAADSPAVQDALGAAGAVEPLVLILAAGPDQLAAKSAALAIASLTNGNQGAPLSCRHEPIF